MPAEDMIAAAQVYASGIPVILMADNGCDALVVDVSDMERFRCEGRHSMPVAETC